MIKYVRSSEYMELKKSYRNKKEFADSEKQSGDLRDLLDRLEGSNVSYDVYNNKTNNGCTVFYDDIKSSVDVEDTNYSGYCYYTAGNDTWGWDARRRLHELGCARGYVKFPKENGGYYRPSLVYMFDSEDTYYEFKQMLSENNLDWHVKVDKYRNMPKGVVILEED